MPQILTEVLKKYVEDVHKIYGDKLRTIILYDSYARGDFRPDSDIDIMILVDLSDDEIRSRGHMLSDMTVDYNFDNDLQIMPIVKNLDHFNKWIRAYPVSYTHLASTAPRTSSREQPASRMRQSSSTKALCINVQQRESTTTARVSG